MKKKSLPLVFNDMFSKSCKPLLVIISFLAIGLNSFSQHVETFTVGCVITGQPVTIDAVVSDAGPATWYQWQYKDQSGSWKCFVNGVNIINGENFNVSGATAQNIANDAPMLTINVAASALEDVLIRVLMRSSASPCNAPTGTTFGGDDLAISETKFLRLYVFGDVSVCPPNGYTCEGNLLINGSGYYGGFENKIYNPGPDNYSEKNFATDAGSSDFTAVTETTPWTNGSNTQAGTAARYQVLDNPYFMNAGFTKDIAPHSGNFQLVVQGSSIDNARAWYKNISVIAGASYTFALFAARIDSTDPVITLKVNGSMVQSYDMSVQPVGTWWRISGQYLSSSTGNITISISDNKAGGLNNYAIDDICFRQCTNCATLPLHHLALNALLQGNMVDLKWIAENEMNTSQFFIERSIDGLSYIGVGTMPTTGQTNTITEYHSSDNIQGVASGNIIYYRIRAVDNIDGRYAYSNVVAVRLTKTSGAKVWPSPFDDNVNISYSSLTNTMIDVSIINSIGKIVRENNFNITYGINQVSMNNLGSLSPGIYFVRLIDKNTSQVYTQKLTK